MGEENDSECENCGHYPWSAKIFKKVGKHMGYTKGEPLAECSCKCHDAKFEKKQIQFTVEKAKEQGWASKKNSVIVEDYNGKTIREGKIITKRQWEEFKKKNSWTGEWENYKKVFDEDLALKAAREQGIVGYRDKGERSDSGGVFTSIYGSRLDGFGRAIHYVEAVKLVVCPVCQRSDFHDTIYENIHKYSKVESWQEGGTDSKSCVAEHEHDFAPCVCGRRICTTAFKDYFGFDYPYFKDDWLEIEKIWATSGIDIQKPKISREIIDKFNEGFVRGETGGYFEPVYYINFLDVFVMMVNEEDTTYGTKVTTDRKTTDDGRDYHG